MGYRNRALEDPLYRSRVLDDPLHRSHVLDDPLYRSRGLADPLYRSRGLADPLHRRSADPLYTDALLDRRAHLADPLYTDPLYRRSAMDTDPLYRRSAMDDPLWRLSSRNLPVRDPLLARRSAYVDDTLQSRELMYDLDNVSWSRSAFRNPLTGTLA